MYGFAIILRMDQFTYLVIYILGYINDGFGWEIGGNGKDWLLGTLVGFWREVFRVIINLIFIYQRY
jgi:hypothetical protein